MKVTNASKRLICIPGRSGTTRLHPGETGDLTKEQAESAKEFFDVGELVGQAPAAKSTSSKAEGAKVTREG